MNQVTPIKVILVDDHAIVRAGFRLLLSTEKDMRVVAETDRCETAWQLYCDHQPDVMVLDLSMPGIGGLAVIERICSKAPTANIIAFSVHDEKVYLSRALAAGAKGYICKNSAPTLLVDAIRAVATGAVFIDPVFGDNTDQPPLAMDYQVVISAFSAREFDIFVLLAKGYTNHKIADELCLGYKTVANYGTQIRTKLKVASVAELAHIALVTGIVKN
jgi:two-component system, NarL family, invasion response regulator UvrY